jgi:SAM-dependent methyltransferase
LKDIHGQAILDYYRGNEAATLLLHTNYGQPEEMSVEVFFREELDFSSIEHLALIECQGKILDLGAGAGAHALVLQSRGFDVYALENSPGCVEVMQASGVSHCLFADYRTHQGKYDTVLMLMNGLGLAGTSQEVPALLKKCISLLNPGGQLLLDSSDISYLYADGLDKPSGYYGEVRYQYEYLGEKGNWFDWVYIDQQLLQAITDDLGLSLEVMMTDENDQYLARITKSV